VIVGFIVARFHGKFDYSIDNKGRVNIPAKFRNSLNPEANDMFTLCRAPGGCLRAYPHDTWEKYEEELLARPETPETLHHKRLLYSTLTDSTLDAQGRITLSPTQIQIAGITKEVTLVGQASYIELWDTVRYDTYHSEHGEDFDQMFFQSVEKGLTRG
jgi:MraZ protein